MTVDVGLRYSAYVRLEQVFDRRISADDAREKISLSLGLRSGSLSGDSWRLKNLTPSMSQLLCVIPFSTLARLFGHFVDYGVRLLAYSITPRMRLISMNKFLFVTAVHSSCYTRLIAQ